MPAGKISYSYPHPSGRVPAPAGKIAISMSTYFIVVSYRVTPLSLSFLSLLSAHAPTYARATALRHRM